MKRDLDDSGRGGKRYAEVALAFRFEEIVYLLFF